MHTEFLCGNLLENVHLEDRKKRREINMVMDFREMDCKDWNCMEQIQDRF